MNKVYVLGQYEHIIYVFGTKEKAEKRIQTSYERYKSKNQTFEDFKGRMGYWIKEYRVE